MDFVEVNEYIDELVNQGLTWREIGELCNEKYKKEYSESKWRKPYQIWRKTVDSVIYAESDKIVEQELKRIARAKLRLDINRQIINQERALLNEDVRNATLVEMFNDELRDVLKENTHLGYIDTKEGQTSLKGASKSKLNYVFIRSDSHYNGNQDLGVEFSELYSIIADKKEEYDFNEIILAELGDTIDGASLRPSQLMALRKGMVHQAMDVARYYIELLNMLTRELNIRVKFMIVESSNHTQLRQLGTGRSELPMEDLMVMISEMIYEGVKGNPNIDFYSAPVIMEEVNGISYIMEHGHEIGNKDGYLQKSESYYNKLFDYAYIGHWHNYKTQDVYEVNGSFYNKNVTFVPHSCTYPSDYANTKRLSSVPAIHFSIDGKDGKKHQENITLKYSYKKMLEKLQEEETQKGKIIKIKR